MPRKGGGHQKFNHVPIFFFLYIRVAGEFLSYFARIGKLPSREGGGTRLEELFFAFQRIEHGVGLMHFCNSKMAKGSRRLTRSSNFV